MILPVWQHIGQSSHQIAASASQILNEKTTHTGTLDPMAQGVLVLLSGNDRFAKEHLSDWKKTYQFSILWGIQTDSGDALGIITNTVTKTPPLKTLQKSIETMCEAFPKTYSQQIPDFSARRFSGASAHEHAKLRTDMPKKFRDISLCAISVDQYEEIDCATVLQKQKKSVDVVKGDFRQEDILENWQSTLPDQATFAISHHTVTVSSGTYIRQLTQDIASELNIPATTWSIVRTVNGPFSQSDCIEMEELSALSSTLDQS